MDNTNFCHFKTVILRKNAKLKLDPQGNATYTEKARVTAAFSQEKTTVRFGLSFCSPEDNFCRKSGRNIATRRYNEEPTELEVSPDASKDDVIIAIREYIRLNSSEPKGVDYKKLNGLPNSWQHFSFLSKDAT